MTQIEQVLIDSLPKNKLQEDNYRLAQSELPDPGAGEVLVKTTAFAVTAGARAGLQGSASYAGGPETGVVMGGTGVGEVQLSNDPGFSPGDKVMCATGWQTHSLHKATALTPIPADQNPIHYLGPLGINGLTAYFGLLQVGRAKAGEVVMVSAAAGSVGHMVGQMAKIQGCSVVGVTGSDDKCRLLTDELGFDAAVNYRDGNYRQQLKDSTAQGVDVYFDNTGGMILGSALFRLNVGGRIACCGVVSQYDTSSPEPGPKGVPGLLINKRLTMSGFLVFDFADQYDSARQQINAWLKSGQLQSRTDEVRGLAQAPAAFVDLLAGGNIGTRVVRLD